MCCNSCCFNLFEVWKLSSEAVMDINMNDDCAKDSFIDKYFDFAAA